MKQVMLAGAVALAIAAPCAVPAAHAAELAVPAASAPVVSEAKIAQVKAMLKLTPSQEAHWPAVAAALRQINRTSAGVFSGAVADAKAVQRVLAAARPLINTFDENQKREAARIVQALGFKVASAF